MRDTITDAKIEDFTRFWCIYFIFCDTNNSYFLWTLKLAIRFLY